jgi:hypothetical protein
MMLRLPQEFDFSPSSSAPCHPSSGASGVPCHHANITSYCGFCGLKGSRTYKEQDTVSRLT